MQEEGSATLYQGLERRGISERTLHHVNAHLTPLAAIIVIPGLLVAPLPMRAAVVAVILIVFSVVVNCVSMYLMKGNRARLVGGIRVATNYVVNIFLSWLLYAAWSPVWLLLLTSIGVAVYQSRRDSLVTGLAIALMLLAVHWNFGESSMLAWTEAGVKASIIILFNLFVNGLMRLEPELIE